MFQKILVPTDASEGSEEALEPAFELAEKYDAELHFFYVVDVKIGDTQDILSTLTGEFEEIGRNATESMKEAAGERGLEAVTEVQEGIPHRSINEYVEENGIDLVVMGTHGRTGLDRVLVGSVTEKIVRTSEVPVMTVGRD